LEASCVALADRLDTLSGIFGLGQIPTGSKDPFALRRASLGVIRILLALPKELDLGVLIDQSIAGYPKDTLQKDTAPTLLNYVIDRLRAWYEDQSIPVETLRAVTATGITSPVEIDRRVQALHIFSGSDAAAALAAANKRVANILAKADDVTGTPREDLLQEAEEKALFEALTHINALSEPKILSGDYAGALEDLSALRAPIDDFFDRVMVNAEDPALRLNRLQLLSALRNSFIRIADIALLSG
jgi:glycyl-tRNA synthetase beta chain